MAKRTLKLWLCMEKELDTVLKIIKSRKDICFEEIPLEVWKPRKFDKIHFWSCNAVYKQNTWEEWAKGCILLFPKKVDLGIRKNFRGITVTALSGQDYNALVLKQPEIEKILRKNQNWFQRNRFTTTQILTILCIIEKYLQTISRKHICLQISLRHLNQ